MTSCPDRVVSVPGGFDCIVRGRQFGTWRSRNEAQAGLLTEQRRADKCEAEESAREIELIDARTRDYHEWCNRE